MYDNNYSIRPRDREGPSVYTAIKSQALAVLRSSIPPNELAILPARSLRHRVACATINAALPYNDVLKGDLEQIKRELYRAMTEARDHADD